MSSKLYLLPSFIVAELCPFFDLCIVNLWNLMNKISRELHELGS